MIGLDVGTSSVKALLADERGAVGWARRDYDLDLGPGGRAELDAMVVARAAESAIAELAATAASSAGAIVAVCAGGSGDEAVWVDAAGVPVAPVPMSLDRRSDSDGRAFVETVGERAFIERTGLPPAGTYPLPRLAWLQRVQPDAARRVERLLAWPEFIAARLGVEPAAESTLAARSAAFDVVARGWDAGLVAAAGCDGRVLPSVVGTGSVLGIIPREVAARLGLPPGVRVVAGGFDQAMATLGVGVRSAGVGHVGAGSWEALSVLAEERPLSLVGLGFSIGPSIAAGPAWTAMASWVGGAGLAWLGRLAGFDPRVGASHVARTALEARDEPTGMVALPELDGPRAGAEERIPGGLIGDLRLDVDAAILARAMLEGLAFRLADAVDAASAAGLDLAELRVSGAGCREHRWLQLRADVAGVPVRGVAPVDVGAAAAAALAAAGAGLGSAEAWLNSLVALGPLIEHRPEHHAAYREMRQRAATIRARNASTVVRPAGAGRT